MAGGSLRYSIWPCGGSLEPLGRPAWSVDDFASGQADLFDVEPGLRLAQHSVVDAALVAEPDDGGALLGEQREAQCGVLLLMPKHRLVASPVTVSCVGAEDLQVLDQRGRVVGEQMVGPAGEFEVV